MVDFTHPNFMPWLIPLGPLLAFFIISLATNRGRMVPATDKHEYGGHHPDYDGMKVPVVTPHSRVLSITVGMSGVVMALLLSFATVGYAFNPPADTNIHHFGQEVFGSDTSAITGGTAWMNLGLDDPAANAEAFNFDIGVLVDPLTVAMLIMVPIAVLCIFIYSIGYMAHDPRQSRFFALISLFAGAMLTLVVADNLLVMFVGWEVMGVCSYLLIGFWFEKESAYKAAIKAFITTRIADVVMLLGIVYLYSMVGTLNFRDILYNEATLEMLTTTPAIFVPTGWGISAASLIGIFLIVGTVGKSAQFPLHVWLPDAMEGPTPVSAMIHAAAMVSAGIYAIIRMYPLFVGAGPGAADPHHGILLPPLVMMAVVGSFTALFAATIAVAQNDVKRVLAYSTISQLGFMMAALGIGAYIAAAFHLITHAFFKALLFMASGSVIHAMEHGEHHVHEHAHHGHNEHPVHDAASVGDETGEHAPQEATAAIEKPTEHVEEHEVGHHFDPQDMMNMGGLRKRIPVTFWTFLIGGFSLAGFPLITAGFWSKDEILADAWYGTANGSGAHIMVFWLLAAAAFLTAFYTMRQIGLTFWGDARTEEAEHAGLGGPRNIISITMQLPLIILAFFALFAGFVGVPEEFPILGSIFSPEYNPFHHFMIETLIAPLHAEAPPFTINGVATPLLTSLFVALGGIALGWWMYWRKPLKAGQEDPMVNILGPVYNLLKNKYYVDEIYQAAIIQPVKWFTTAITDFLDKGVIDTVLHTIARVATWIGDFAKVMNHWLIDGVGDGIPEGIYDVGGWLRRLQTGRVQQYLLFVVIATVVIAIIFVLTSGASAAP